MANKHKGKFVVWLPRCQDQHPLRRMEFASEQYKKYQDAGYTVHFDNWHKQYLLFDTEADVVIFKLTQF